MLNDGSVLPSFMTTKKADPRATYRKRITEDFALRIGTVIAVRSPRDDKSLTKTAYEFDVEVVTSDGIGVPTTTVYPHCRMATGFGGVADKMLWSPWVRVHEKLPDGSAGAVKSPGSKVAVLCPNGISGQAYIIAGIEPDGAPEQSQDFYTKGQASPMLRWQFNGTFFEVNGDGELTLTRLGPMTAAGKPVDGDDKKVGASAKLDKNGQIVLTTGDGKNVITMNIDEGLIVIKADKDCTVEVADGKFETNASKGVRLGGDEKMVKGDTYVDAEKQFVSAFSTFLTQLSAVAATLGGAVIEPTSIAAGTQLTAAIQVFNPKLIVFQTHLETKDVLSLKNTTE